MSTAQIEEIIINHCTQVSHDGVSVDTSGAAAAIIAAGYRKPRTITTTAEAVEAAARQMAADEHNVMPWTNYQDFARAALEAAAPIIAALAWDEGYEAGEDHGDWSAAPVREEPISTNPYAMAKQ